MPPYKFDEKEAKHHQVRLFPTVGIKKREAEMRATAALLAMVRAVVEFGGTIIKKAGGPGGKGKNVQCFTEVSFLPDFPEDNDLARPDGIIRRIYGKKVWTALVEVKVGNNPIDEKQVANYLKWANLLNFDTLITISNEITKPNGDPPYGYNRKIQRVKVKHFSWESIHSEIRLLCGKKGGIEDVDQKWMLEELDQYLADVKSRIIAPPTLGDHWHQALKDVKANTLNVNSTHLKDVVKHWLAFLRVASLKMGAKIGEKVKVKIPGKFRNDPEGFIKEKCKKTIDNRCILTGELIFPVIGGIHLRLDLGKKEIQLSHKIDAPEKGYRDTRLKWIIRELKKLEKVPLSLRVKVDWKKRGLITSEMIKNLDVDEITPLLYGRNGAQIGKNVLPKHFYLELETCLQGTRGKGSAKELEGVLDDLEKFYGLMQPINRPTKKPPPLPKDEESKTEAEV